LKYLSSKPGFPLLGAIEQGIEINPGEIMVFAIIVHLVPPGKCAKECIS